MVGLGRFELPTSRLSGVRSNQLSYRPARVDRRRSNQALSAAIHLSENREETDSLKTEQERLKETLALHYCRADSFRPQVHHRDLVMIRGERAP